MITDKIKENIMENSTKTKRIIRNLNDRLANAVGLERKGSILYAKAYNCEEVKNLMHRVKRKQSDAFMLLALKLYMCIPKNATLIPIPSSDGTIDVNLEVLDLIASLRKDIKIQPVLLGKPRRSWYDLKKDNIPVISDFFGFYNTDSNIYYSNNTYFFDGVIDTGSTYRAACEVMGVRLPIITYANNVETKKVEIDLTPIQTVSSNDKIYWVRYFFFGVEISLEDEPGHSKYADAYCVATSKKIAEDKIRRHALNQFNRVCAIDSVKIAQHQDADYYSRNKKALIY